MKRSVLMLVCLFAFFVGSIPAFGEEAKTTVTFEAKTGDVEFDGILGDLNIEAQVSIPDFIAELSLSYGVSQETVENLLVKDKIPPADAYMIVAAAHTLQQPVDGVVAQYKTNQGKGWGVIAQRLGIKPGSKEFHALKNGGVVELEKVKATKKTKTDKQQTTTGKQKEKTEKSQGKKDSKKK
jgi:hypothetical protein